MNFFPLCFSIAPKTRRIAPGRSSVITLLAPPEAVFNYLADIETLPQWAPGFCEDLFLGRGRWMALTSLGELFLALDVDVLAREIVLRAGGDPERLRSITLQVTPRPEGGTRVKFTLEAGADDEQAKLYAAIEAELPNLVARLSHGMFSKTAGC